MASMKIFIITYKLMGVKMTDEVKAYTAIKAGKRFKNYSPKAQIVSIQEVGK